MPTHRGLPCCSCSAEWLPEFELTLADLGIKVRFTQLDGTYAASAGTHAGGAFDLVVTDRGKRSLNAAYRAVVKRARQMGASATWERPYNWNGRGGIRHIHGLLNGCPHLSSAALHQQAEVKSGRNGLANRAKDTGYRLKSGLLPKRTWRQGIAWARKKRKPLRLVTWNVGLNRPRKNVDAQRRKIRGYLRRWKPDVLAVQEAPNSGAAKALWPMLVPRLGLTIRVGGSGRYLLFREGTTVHGWKTVTVAGKKATIAVATIRGRKRVFVCAHAVSGSDKGAERERYAAGVMKAARAYGEQHGVPASGDILMGDWNGAEAATVGKDHGLVRARTHARIKSKLVRTYNAWGKKRHEKGGHLDYVLVHKSLKNAITKAKTFYTPKASDHNAVFTEIKE